VTVSMNHPDLPGALIEVPEAAVNGHKRSGWRIVGSDRVTELSSEHKNKAAVESAQQETNTAEDGKEK
jgi:hypothetical protein